MRERTRRLVCRIAFLAICVAPTMVTSGWVAYRRSPIHAAAERASWQDTLERKLGLRATIEHVLRPRRGVAVLKGVMLTDPDSQRQLLQVRVVEVARTDHGWVVLLSQPEVFEDQFLRVWGVFQERILRGAPPNAATQVIAAEVTVRARPLSLTFTDVRASLEPTASGIKTICDFRVAGIDMPSPAQWAVSRSRESGTPATSWQLRTGLRPLPCSLFADYCPALQRLGARCRFQGSVWAEQARDGWNGDIAGELHDVDLGRLLEPFPHKLSGDALVVLNQARFAEGRLREAAGALRGGQGVISASLLTAFSEAFQMKLESREHVGDEPLLQFQQLALGFQLDAHGVKVIGLCEGTRPGVLVVDRAGPLLLDTKAEPVPAVALARALSPDNQLLVPATRQTDFLLRALPLPNLDPPAAATARRSYSPLRLKTDTSSPAARR